jgi:hypothetical protein
VDALIEVFHLFGEREQLDLMGDGGLVDCGVGFVDLVDVKQRHRSRFD